jgi:hypothetical protein
MSRERHLLRTQLIRKLITPIHPYYKRSRRFFLEQFAEPLKVRDPQFEKSYLNSLRTGLCLNVLSQHGMARPQDANVRRRRHMESNCEYLNNQLQTRNRRRSSKFWGFAGGGGQVLAVNKSMLRNDTLGTGHGGLLWAFGFYNRWGISRLY